MYIDVWGGWKKSSLMLGGDKSVYNLKDSSICRYNVWICALPQLLKLHVFKVTKYLPQTP